MKWIDIKEYLVVQAFDKQRAAEVINQWGVENRNKRDETENRRVRKFNALTADNFDTVETAAQKLIENGYRREGENYFKKTEDDIQIGLYYFPNTNTVEIITCKCQVACCGVSIGEVPFSIYNINKEIKEWYEN